MLDNHQLVQKILETLSMVSFLEKKRQIRLNDEDDQKLYPSEIHLLLFLHSQQDTNITSIGHRLNLSKGAVSQTITRIQKKGLIIKKPNPDNKNELKVVFTPKGSAALEKIAHLIEHLSSMYLEYLERLSDHDKYVISEFLDTVQKTLTTKH